METKDKKEKITIQELIETGSELTGNITGAVISVLYPGAAGSIAGTAAGVLLTKGFKKLGAEIKKRTLGNREEVRIGAAYSFSISKLNQKIELGIKLREDDYFKHSEKNRATSEEILEGALLSAQKEFEELKVKHYGYLVANICFNDKIDRSFANFLLRTTEKISYRQLCVLEFFDDPDKYITYKKPDSEVDTRHPRRDGTIGITLGSKEVLKATLRDWKGDLDAEINELNQLGLITSGASLSPKENDYRLTSNGYLLKGLLELNELDQKDIVEIARLLL